MARAVELAVAARAGGANAKSTLHFEGLEDVDVEKGPSLRGLTTATVNGREFVQVKTASKPWGLRTFDHDQEVVCVAGETVPSAFEFLVQRVERDVGHQGRQRPALRHPLKRRLAGAVRQDHPSGEIAADQTQNQGVADLYLQLPHQPVVSHGIE